MQAPVLFGGKKPDPSKLESFHTALGILEGFLEGQKFSAGNELTVADHSLIASVATAHECGIDVSKYKNISGWMTTCREVMPGYETENEKGAKILGEMAKSKFAMA